MVLARMVATSSLQYDGTQDAVKETSADIRPAAAARRRE
jgi:hypothetical protein